MKEREPPTAILPKEGFRREREREVGMGGKMGGGSNHRRSPRGIGGSREKKLCEFTNSTEEKRKFRGKGTRNNLEPANNGRPRKRDPPRRERSSSPKEKTLQREGTHEEGRQEEEVHIFATGEVIPELSARGRKPTYHSRKKEKKTIFTAGGKSVRSGTTQMKGGP